MSLAAMEEDEDVVTIAPFRDRFFASVRRALGENRGDMAVLDGRFIIQADLVFDPFTDTLNRPGKSVLQVIARGLTKTVGVLPDDLRSRWVFQLDIHSCASQLLESAYADKRALTQAQRASLAAFLADQGVHGDRVVLNAYGDMAPMDRGRSEKSLRKNRRIEFSLINPFESVPADDVEPAEAKDEIGWRQIDQKKERARGPNPIRNNAAPMAPPPPPRTTTLAELHGNLDDVRKEHDALRAQKPVDAPEDATVQEEHHPFPHDFALSDLDRFPGFRTGMVVFSEQELDEDGDPLIPRKQPGMLQHALTAVG